MIYLYIFHNYTKASELELKYEMDALGVDVRTRFSFRYVFN